MKTLLAALILSLAGCATTSPGVPYRAAGQIDAWQIAGAHNGAGGISITINGAKVIEGSMGLFYGVGSYEFSGTYGGKPISAECDYKNGFSRYIQCMVFVGNERAAILRL